MTKPPNIVHIENPGAAFGMLSDSPGRWRGIFLVGVSLTVMSAIAFMLWRPQHAGMHDTVLLRIGLALVFGGALGNLIEWPDGFFDEGEKDSAAIVRAVHERL